MTLYIKAYELQICPPKAEDADSDNKVLWFHPKLGWHQGDYRFPVYTDCTHWTYLPERPVVKDPAEVAKEGFQAWLRTFPTEFPAAAQALLELGFKAGAAFARKPK